MDSTRRRTLQMASVPVVGTLLSGCLSLSAPGTSGDDGEGPGGDGDVDDLSIDGRLHNEAETPVTFTVTIRDQDGAAVAEGEWGVDDGSSKTLPAFGKPGQRRTYEVTVDGVTATETLTLDVEPAPGERDGYVDIVYTAAGAVEIDFTPLIGDGAPPEPRVDEPPYDISEPECDPPVDGRDPLWLCENLPSEPTLLDEQVEETGTVLRDEGLSLGTETGDTEFYATVLTTGAEIDRVAADWNSAVVELIEETNFDTDAVLIAQTGWGSGSVTPHLERIEETDDGIHAFGCYRRPCGQTDDYTSRTVVARFERPESLETAIVSLTVDADTRVHFTADEGVVAVELSE